jgi:hypothetical protein
MLWRRRRDSNPRDGSPSAPLAGVCLRPLGHVSDCRSSRDGGGETRRNSRQEQDRSTGRGGAAQSARGGSDRRRRRFLPSGGPGGISREEPSPLTCVTVRGHKGSCPQPVNPAYSSKTRCGGCVRLKLRSCPPAWCSSPLARPPAQRFHMAGGAGGFAAGHR